MNTSKLILGFLIISTASFAQSKKYEKTMLTNISTLYETKVLGEFDPIINKFSRIGKAEKSQWEPYYYSALAQTFKAFRIKDLNIKDVALGQGLAALKLASDISENNAEIIALEGFINMLKISVDPVTRGQLLTPKIMALYGKALSIDSSNPRTNLFMGQMQMGTAQFFGTSVEQPCQMIDKSIELFDNQKQSASLAPMWGKSGALQAQEGCKVALGEVAKE